MKPSRIAFLRVHEIDSQSTAEESWTEYKPGSIPGKHLWAYRHIIEHECGSLSCGKTVFEVVYRAV